MGFRFARSTDYGGQQICVKGRKLVRNCKQALTKAAWKRMGFRPKPGVLDPVNTYRDDQVEPLECQPWKDLRFESMPTCPCGVSHHLRIINLLAFRARQLNMHPRKVSRQVIVDAISKGELARRSASVHKNIVLMHLRRQMALVEQRSTNRVDNPDDDILERLLTYSYSDSLREYCRRICAMCQQRLVKKSASRWTSSHLLYEGDGMCHQCYNDVLAIDGPKPETETTIDVLAALWAINRQAKRYRSAANSASIKRRSNVVTYWHRRIQKMYAIKGQVLHYLLADKVVEHIGYHRFSCGYAEVLGRGDYTFHRPCPIPKDASNCSNLDMIVAKRRAPNEPLYADAIAALTQYLEDKPEVPVFRWPERNTYH
jgi:hypothetical protein